MKNSSNTLSKFLVLVIFTATVISACKKNVVDDPVPPLPPDPDPEVTVPFTDTTVLASLQGKVFNEAGKPWGAVQVRSGNNYTNTGDKGDFTIRNTQLGKLAGFFTAEKCGYFKVTRTLMVNAGASNYSEIKLIKKTEKGNFSAVDGGTINLESGSSLEISANRIVNSSTGTAYSGTVHVAAELLDPTDADFTMTMPGNLTGLDTAKQLKLLQSYGIMAIELVGGAAEELNIAPGKNALIKFPIPTTLLSAAPINIPLWFFNDSTGLWQEEGHAVKEGNFYKGTVTHLSYWSINVQGKLAKLKMKLTDGGDDPFTFYKVKLINPSNGAVAHVYTDNAGDVDAPVPVNTVLNMEVYAFCGSKISETQIGPFSADADLGTIKYNFESAASITISGDAVDCAGAKVSRGQATLFYNGAQYTTTVTGGLFSFTLNRCDSVSAASKTANLVVSDLDAAQSSGTKKLTIGSGDIFLDHLVVCTVTIDQMVNFSINDTGNFALSAPPDSFYAKYQPNTVTVFEAFRKNQSNYKTSFSFSGDSTEGEYPLDTMQVSNGTLNLKSIGTGNITITEYGAKGGFIRGIINAALKDSGGGDDIYQIKGSFKFRRQ